MLAIPQVQETVRSHTDSLSHGKAAITHRLTILWKAAITHRLSTLRKFRNLTKTDYPRKTPQRNLYDTKKSSAQSCRAISWTQAPHHFGVTECMHTNIQSMTQEDSLACEQSCDQSRASSAERKYHDSPLAPKLRDQVHVRLLQHTQSCEHSRHIDDSLPPKLRNKVHRRLTQRTQSCAPSSTR